MRLDRATNEGRALAVLLSIIGQEGRAFTRTALLNAAVQGLPDAKHTLDVMNEFERAFDELARSR